MLFLISKKNIGKQKTPKIGDTYLIFIPNIYRKMKIYPNPNWWSKQSACPSHQSQLIPSSQHWTTRWISESMGGNSKLPLVPCHSKRNTWAQIPCVWYAGDGHLTLNITSFYHLSTNYTWPHNNHHGVISLRILHPDFLDREIGSSLQRPLEIANHPLVAV